MDSNKEELKRGMIYLTKHGSNAYGLATPESDLDIKGVFIAPREYYLSYHKRVEQIEEKEPNDSVIYEIRKFFKLAAECNPNIIEVLFTDESDIIAINPLGQLLRDNARLFLSQKARFTFSGYAHSQLKRIRGHYKWLKNPPKSSPIRSTYGLPEKTLIPRDQLAAAEAVIQKKIDSWNIDTESLDEAAKIQLQAELHKYLSELLRSGFGPDGGTDSADLQDLAATAQGFSRDFIAILQKEKQYKNAKNEWTQYQTWVATRNPARAALERKYGYDTKHGMHLVRLLRMGEEILQTGQVIVRRPDRDELLAIRNEGAWSYEKLVEYAEQKDRDLKEFYDSGQSPLPKRADVNKLDKLLSKIILKSWGKWYRAGLWTARHLGVWGS